MMFRVGVRILPRNEVLDSQGRAVQKVLSQNKLPAKNVRVGRYVVLELETKNKEEALKKANEISRQVLHNPLIETFEVEVI